MFNGSLVYLYIPKIITALVVLTLAWVINKNIQKPLNALEKKGALPPELAILINKSIKAIIYAIGIITALAQLGVKIYTILASLGIGGLAISFALKDALTNVISGIIIIAYRPFVIGDYISLRVSSSGTLFEGKVTNMNFRYVTIELEGQRTLIPNTTAVSLPVIVRK